ncbi:MAG: hypothetical protein M1533_00530 [Candidatus Thermoplasmatota archaeon]|jgi:hypothetical protein|nr:hypothetical protein [Candidatus Thermoplasmatota archaeon]MCL5794266.1 hypothetical protein [Candidatus Thermoplasmatota archaeon]
MTTQSGNEDMVQIERFKGMRRAYGLAAGASLAFLMVIFSELDTPIFAVDDAVVALTGGIAVLVILFLKRNDLSLPSLKWQSNLFFILLLIGYLVVLAWIPIELGDPDAVGDDFSSIIFLAVIVANRLL